MLWLFNHKRANFCFQIWDFFSLFSFLKQSLHKGEYNCAEKVFLIHFINMQLNFPVLSLFNCVAPQKAGFMACRMQVQLFSLFLETEHFLKRSYLRTSLLQATLLLHSVHTDKTKEKWIIFHTLDKIADFH